MPKKTASQPAAAPDAADPHPSPASREVSVALTAGAAEMYFAGRFWRRDEPQTIPAEHWAGMQSRNAAALGFVLITTPEEN